MWLDSLYHSLSPIAFAVGPFVVRWYGLAYLAAFVLAGVVIFRVSRRWQTDIMADDVMNVMCGIAFGVVLGARLWYVLFYGAGYYLQDPAKILAFSEGGMSFHGGLIGAVIGGTLVCRHQKISVLSMCDKGVIAAPLGLFLGRCANFVNGELWGKETTLPWGVMFSETGGGMVYRHPSQLYEALLEGALLFALLFWMSRRVPARPQGTFTGAFLVFYGCARFLVEFVRLPDEQLGYLLGTNWVTMGQLQSLPLVLLGVALLVWARRTRRPQVGYLS